MPDTAIAQAVPESDFTQTNEHPQLQEPVPFRNVPRASLSLRCLLPASVTQRRQSRPTPKLQPESDFAPPHMHTPVTDTKRSPGLIHMVIFAGQ